MQSTEKSTIDDVASEAKVSPATVSRVVNGTGSVAEETRERVETAIEHLEYRPDRTAKSLAQGQAQTLAVAMPTFTTPFHTALLKGIRDRMKGVDTDVLLCDLRWETPGRSLQRFLERGTIDGLLAVGLPVTDDVRGALRGLGGPVVLIGDDTEGLDAFHWDETTGARLATEHLIRQGHTRVAMITTHHDSPIRHARVVGYEEALRDAGIDPTSAWVAGGETEKHDGFSEEAGAEAMRALLRREISPTAVFASSDVQAIGAWRVLREEGLAVPDDVALVGYDDIKVSRFIGLTSVSQKMQSIGEAATDLLLRRVRGTGPPERRSCLVSPELQIRWSSSENQH